ncbi:MAG TPA: carbohydrate porin [Stenotrophomonas sp.]|jgi:maltoporin
MEKAVAGARRQQEGEVRKVTRYAMLCCAGLLAVPGGAAAWESKGYLRAGAGSTVEGEQQRCFGLQAAPSKYRLGNECEQFAEVELEHTFQPWANGSALRLVARESGYNPYGDRPDFSGRDGWHKNSELWAQWRDVPGLRGGALWAGRRFYKRNDVHINDFYYWNPTGVGAGVEDIAIGTDGMKLSYAFFRRGDIGDDRYVSRHDLQWEGIATNPGGRVAIGLSVIPRPGIDGAHGGWSLTAQHEQKGVLGGRNRLALQYGRGAGIGLGATGDLNAGSSAWRWRIVESLDWQPSERFGGQWIASWQRDRGGNAISQDWWSIGVRPVLAFGQHFKLALELGRDAVRPQQGPDQHLDKATLAAILTRAPGFYKRPELRVFYTYADWNGAAQLAGRSNTAPLLGAAAGLPPTQGSTFGVQLETWW